MKRIISLVLVVVLLSSVYILSSRSRRLFSEDDLEGVYTDELAGTTLKIYNWGEYISDGSGGTYDVVRSFEKITGINVEYAYYDDNETMYSKLKTGASYYDIIIPSDYMVERLIREDMLKKVDVSSLSNYKYIDEKYRGLYFDPNDEYSIPYSVGMVGLIYNTKMVEEAPNSWTALWDERYSGNVLMINNPRDAFAIAQSVLGMDYNMESEVAWKVASQLLKEQKTVSPVYVNDEVFLKMESGEAALAPYYAGDFLTMQENNPDLKLVFPKEGVNYFFDSACILKGSKNNSQQSFILIFFLNLMLHLQMLNIYAMQALIPRFLTIQNIPSIITKFFILKKESSRHSFSSIFHPIRLHS
jgi:spermidine/putrescine transport system substrate-binding protein